MTDREINKIANNKKIKFCYIKKRGSYYRPNCSGYTDFTYKAGVYAKEDAVSQATSCRELDLIPIDITKHNERIANEIKDLSSRFINTIE